MTDSPGGECRRRPGSLSSRSLGAPVRDADKTRRTILQAARNRFAAQGYDGVGLRQIAADAGVDAALVSRYFGAKAGLYRATLASCEPWNPRALGEHAGFGRRLARRLMFDVGPKGELDALVIMLRSLGSAGPFGQAADVLQCDYEAPVAAWLGAGAGDPVRARLITAVILGVVATREIDDAGALTPTQQVDLSRRIANLVQSLVDEPDDDRSLDTAGID